MDTQTIIAELEAERDRLDEAIRALQGARRGPGRPRTAGGPGGNGRRGRRTLSPAARRRISEGMKKRWAKAKASGKNAL